jgi:hypothetical protein
MKIIKQISSKLILFIYAILALNFALMICTPLTTWIVIKQYNVEAKVGQKGSTAASSFFFLHW